MAQISYRGELQASIGKTGESVDAAKISEVLRYIRSAYGKAAWTAAKKMLIVVNDESILLRKVYRTPLAPGDVVCFLPICGGG